MRVMKGHTKHITALAVDHGSSQVHAYGLDGLDVLTLLEVKETAFPEPRRFICLGRVLHGVASPLLTAANSTSARGVWA